MVSAISAITVCGVAVGVFSLIVTLAIMKGFYVEMLRRFVSLTPHVQITRASARPEMAFTSGTLQAVRSVPGVKAVMPWFDRTALLRAPGGRTKAKVIEIIAYDPDEGPKILPGLKEIGGDVRLDKGQILLYKKTMQVLGVTSGSKLMAAFPESVSEKPRSAPVTRSLQVTGSLSLDIFEVDNEAFMNLDELRDMFHVKDSDIWRIAVALDDPDQAAVVKSVLKKRLGRKFRIVTWREQIGSFTEVLGTTQKVIFAIQLQLILVAALNIIGTLIMVVMEKTREIGSLKAMGASHRQIGRVFLLHGLSVGSAGTLIGGLLSMVACYLLKYHIKLTFFARLVGVDRFYVYVDPLWTMLIVLSAVLISLTASLYPARRAARLDPVEALRYE